MQDSILVRIERDRRAHAITVTEINMGQLTCTLKLQPRAVLQLIECNRIQDNSHAQLLRASKSVVTATHTNLQHTR